MKLGAHVSIAGGLPNAPANAGKLDCEIFQIFSRSPRGGNPPEITPQVIKDYKAAMKVHKQVGFYIHSPYFTNLGSDKERVYRGTIEILKQELERGNKLGASGVMFHMGSSKDLGKEETQAQVLKGLKEILKGYSGKTKLLLENSAGAGNIIGDEFEELAYYIKRVKSPNLGICLDTCHMFASGYDMRDKKALNKTLNEFDKLIGLKHLMVIHANDSKTDFESHKDRHEIIGQGLIGKIGFDELVNHPKLKNVDVIVETPDLKDGKAISLKLLQKMKK
ncbi:endonuclease [Candidatus Falkowbacteria bacterium CG10_big_fil_rev_8_21_14_0_10_39_11]|uniref:Probable endonuclease 4 n=1 Tax=Candidatus Falkowbacteria bacterium CG10_big_fil_rev_8_21_14_0_10_39_11 TaxID=1974565 RepID=A0A2H0V5U1_9BACT|nr:MAG: endonuclease [Candidatus Falkowbacteria bacterium CG10_big_fil_rev_8_21_14_0_10_39_11]